MTEEAPGGLAAGIFAVLLTLHLFLKYYSRITRSGELTLQERELLKEIKELHRTANELSTPATFSKSAKLKRTAAAKEKELGHLRQEQACRNGWFVTVSRNFPRALKIAVYLLLAGWFWHTSIANIPVALLKPADYFLFVERRDDSGDLVAVGIIPWLILSSRVCEYVSEKIAGVSVQKSTSQRA